MDSSQSAPDQASPFSRQELEGAAHHEALNSDVVQVDALQGDDLRAPADRHFHAHPDHAEAVNAALHAIRQLVEDQPGFADVLRSALTTDDARRALLEHGIEITSEALWRHRGSLLKDGHPTWRG